GAGVVREPSEASGGSALLLKAGEYAEYTFDVASPAIYTISLRASNAGAGDLETVEVLLNGLRIGMPTPVNTGDANVFVITAGIGTVGLWSGAHSITLRVSGGDSVSPEVDWIRLDPQGPISVNKAWVNRTLFAIDQGFMLLHLENERSGLIWRLSGGNANILRALERLRPITTVSAASLELGRSMTPDSIASTFGVGLATTLEAAPTPELPTELAGTTATLLDGAGTLHQCRLYFVSSGQSNWWIPASAALGQATLTFTEANGTFNRGTFDIERVVPSLFSADSSGTGAPAAILLRVAADGTQTAEFITTGSEVVCGPAGE
ncbi:MAG: carbohydrate-binding protein, partial [bacterium]|nr:carbohydrate-binding protein [bacterium]